MRHYLQSANKDSIHRIVMIAPPNQGSEVVDQFSDWPIVRDWSSFSLTELGTKSNSTPLSLGSINGFEIGVIAGNKSINPLFSAILPGEDDGAVSVERTKLEGMTDFIVLPYSHSVMMYRKEVISQALFFLANGNFKD